MSFDDVSAWLTTCTAMERASLANALTTDIEQQRSAAQEEGFAAGQAQALEEAQIQTQSLLSALGALVQGAQTAFEKEAAQLAAQCAEVVSEAFFKMAGTQLAMPEAALGTVLEVLRRIKEEREVLIRVSAVDLPLLQACEEELTSALAGKKFSLLADSRVEVGGCIVETQLGSLDGRLENQLRALCETIRAAKLAHQEAR
jgi:flagellar assembly protein FliH